MEKRSSSMIRRLIHRDSLPQLTFGHQSNANKEKKTRRKSEGMVRVPEHVGPVTEQNPTPFWYLKEIQTRDEAEELLNTQRVGTYLVRHSETSKLAGAYTLSLRHKDKCRHHKIETNPRNNKLVIKGYENHQFEDLEKLVEFFVKSQRKDIYLTPYNPNEEDKEDGLINREEQQPAYEEMGGELEQQEAYQEMGCNDNDMRQQMKLSFKHNPQVTGAPPPLPSRKDGPPQQSSYVNMAPKGAVPPVPSQAPQSYENIPPKDRSSLPPPPSPKDAPPLPPRVAAAGPGSYENIPGRPPTLPRNYENHDTSQKYENYFPKNPPAHSIPGRSYQNLPPKITPRKTGKVSYSAEQNLPPRKPPAALRRSQTDTSEDWQRRGYNKNQ